MPVTLNRTAPHRQPPSNCSLMVPLELIADGAKSMLHRPASPGFFGRSDGGPPPASLTLAWPQMRAKIEAELATATGPAEEQWLRQRAELIRGLLAPRSPT